MGKGEVTKGGGGGAEGGREGGGMEGGGGGEGGGRVDPERGRRGEGQGELIDEGGGGARVRKRRWRVAERRRGRQRVNV